MNFPGWDWKNKKIKPGTPYPVLHQTFDNIMDSHHLVQIVEENTRKGNTLDLILTNSPSAVLRVDVLPGVSYHDMVFVEFDAHTINYGASFCIGELAGINFVVT